jgi:hypothetical protein
MGVHCRCASVVGRVGRDRGGYLCGAAGWQIGEQVGPCSGNLSSSSMSWCRIGYLELARSGATAKPPLPGLLHRPAGEGGPAVTAVVAAAVRAGALATLA